MPDLEARVRTVFDLWSRPEEVRLRAGEIEGQVMKAIQQVLECVRLKVEGELLSVKSSDGSIEARVEAVFDAHLKPGAVRKLVGKAGAQAMRDIQAVMGGVRRMVAAEFRKEMAPVTS